jgi:hypothetical protein
MSKDYPHGILACNGYGGDNKLFQSNYKNLRP